MYFITFTCFRWKPLIELTNAYDAVYKWFDYLTAKKASIIGYVIMPDHIHLLVYLPPDFKTPNAVVANAKRFLAYEIIKRLKAQSNEPLLQELHDAVKEKEAKKDKFIKCLKKALIARSASARSLSNRNLITCTRILLKANGT